MSQGERLSSERIVRGASVNAALTLVSRVLGFVRDLLVARLFGASPIADAFFVAYRIPNLLRSFVAEGALTAAFVPVFSSHVQKDLGASRNALREVSAFLLILTATLTLIGVIFSPFIVRIFAPGFFLNSELGDLCVFLTRLMFPYIIFVSFVALVGGALNTLHHYGAAAWSQVVMNLVLIVGAVVAGFMGERDGVITLALSVILGGIIQVLIQLPALSRLNLSIVPHLRCWTVTTRSVLNLMVPATIGAAVYQITIFLGTVIASLLPSGSVSWLFYADRVTQLPIGIFTVALGTVMLPVLSRARAANDQSQFIARLVDSLRLTTFVIIPVAVFLYWSADIVVALLFQRGAFTEVDTIMTAKAVRGIAIGLWGISCHSMVSRAFLASKDTKTVTAVGLGGLALYLIFALHFVGPINSDAGQSVSYYLMVMQELLVFESFSFAGAHQGLVVASALSATISFGVLLGVALVRFKDLTLISTYRAILNTGIATIVMYFSLQSSSGFISNLYPGNIVTITLSLVIACTVYISVHLLLKSMEIRQLFDLVRRIVNRSRD